MVIFIKAFENVKHVALLHINLGNTDIIGQGLCSKGVMVVASKAIPSHCSVEYVYTVIMWKSYGFFEGMYLKTN